MILYPVAAPFSCPAAHQLKEAILIALLKTKDGKEIILEAGTEKEFEEMYDILNLAELKNDI